MTMTDQEWEAIRDCLETSMIHPHNIYGILEEMLRATYERMSCSEDLMSMVERAKGN